MLTGTNYVYMNAKSLYTGEGVVQNLYMQPESIYSPGNSQVGSNSVSGELVLDSNVNVFSLASEAAYTRTVIEATGKLTLAEKPVLSTRDESSPAKP